MWWLQTDQERSRARAPCRTFGPVRASTRGARPRGAARHTALRRGRADWSVSHRPSVRRFYWLSITSSITPLPHSRTPTSSGRSHTLNTFSQRGSYERSGNLNIQCWHCADLARSQRPPPSTHQFKREKSFDYKIIKEMFLRRSSRCCTRFICALWRYWKIYIAHVQHSTF